MSDVEVYYFGAWGGPGHHLWTTGGRRAHYNTERSLPWRTLDYELAGDPALEDPRQRGRWDSERQTEGQARLHHRDGWTALAFWDRSCDPRHGSNSVLVARGQRSASDMRSLFERSFPSVWQRITARFEVAIPAASAR